MLKECFIYYDFGIHHLWIAVPESSMRAVIDNLSSEFEIHIETVDVPIDLPFSSGFILKTTTYSITSYYGEKYEIAKFNEKIE